MHKQPATAAEVAKVTTAIAEAMTPAMFYAFNGVLRATIAEFCRKRGFPAVGEAFLAAGDPDAYPIARVFSGEIRYDRDAEGRLSESTRERHAAGLALLAAHPGAARDTRIRAAFDAYAAGAFTGAGDEDTDALAEELDYLMAVWVDLLDAIGGDVCASEIIGTLSAAWDVVTALSILTDRMVPICHECAACERTNAGPKWLGP